MGTTSPATPSELDKWQAAVRLRERELDIKAAELEANARGRPQNARLTGLGQRNWMRVLRRATGINPDACPSSQALGPGLPLISAQEHVARS